ncbi:MAG TPA: DUF4157 domain-containing protein, partial [Clostridia bacterium]|nr:DUF4157 domain-containing protein [Clostridia bacterium]
QRQEIPEEEEPLQGKMIESIQRQEIPEEEEPLQGKIIDTIQQQEIPEEEEPLQGKMAETIQCQEIPEEEEPLQTKRENNTGMPDSLRAGVENLSGIDMSDVRVHYNSSKPAEVGALAYTQGTNIHVAPGQERHLPHEAWHVVQQAQGRVRPTMQLKGLAANDDVGLEKEANIMGERAVSLMPSFITVQTPYKRRNPQEVAGTAQGNELVIQGVFDLASLNIAGAIDHISTLQDMSTKKGIVGCHNKDNFMNLANQFQITNLYDVGINGVEHVSYKMYKKDRTQQFNEVARVGERIEYELGAQVFEKTIYDPGVWSNERLTEAITEALNEANANGNYKDDGSFRGECESYNVTFELWCRGGVLQTFYFIEDI